MANQEISHIASPKKRLRYPFNFIAGVDVSAGPDDCWPWLGCRVGGYGQCRMGGKVTYTHIIAWIRESGPVPDGMDVLHSCDNPPCCNPKHLFLGDAADNAADMKKKGRSHKLKKHDGPVLTEKTVHEIFQLVANGDTYAAVGDKFTVSGGHIHAIMRGRAWPNVLPPREIWSKLPKSFQRRISHVG